MSESSPKPTYVNVPMSAEEEARVQREEIAWGARKITIVSLVFLGGCLVLLWAMANLRDWLHISNQ